MVCSVDVCIYARACNVFLLGETLYITKRILCLLSTVQCIMDQAQPLIVSVTIDLYSHNNDPRSA